MVFSRFGSASHMAVKPFPSQAPYGLASVPAFAPRSIQRPTWNEISRHNSSFIYSYKLITTGKGCSFFSFSLISSFKYIHLSIHAAQSNSFRLTQSSSCRRSRPATPGFAEAIASRAPL